MISVVIPTYNRARYLREAIESVLKQTYQNFEIIVVDDGSTDNTKEVVSSYGNRINYIFQENKERSAARNNGIIHAKGEYIALLDSDDMWLPNHLEVCFRALHSKPDAGLSFSKSYLINENGNIVSKLKLSPFNGDALKDIVSRISNGGCNSSSCLIKKCIFDNAGYFNEDRDLAVSGEDWEMWVRIAACTNFVSTNAYTVKIRFQKEISSISVDKMAKAMTKAMDTVYSNVYILPKIKRLKNRAYSSLYTLIAINYYASGDMVTARKYLNKALLSYPASIFTNRYLLYTFLRSLLGSKLSSRVRKAKWILGNKIYTHDS